MSRLAAIPVSVLDLAPIRADGDATGALRDSLDLARCAEELGYTRFDWNAAKYGTSSGIQNYDYTLTALTAPSAGAPPRCGLHAARWTVDVR